MGFEACLDILFMLVVFVLAIMRRRQTACLDFAIRPATKGFVPQQAAQASAKPHRVRNAIIELASLLPQCSCRALSRVFNHSYLDPGDRLGHRHDRTPLSIDDPAADHRPRQSPCPDNWNTGREILDRPFAVAAARHQALRQTEEDQDRQRSRLHFLGLRLCIALAGHPA